MSIKFRKEVWLQKNLLNEYIMVAEVKNELQVKMFQSSWKIVCFPLFHDIT